MAEESHPRSTLRLLQGLCQRVVDFFLQALHTQRRALAPVPTKQVKREPFRRTRARELKRFEKSGDRFADIANVGHLPNDALHLYPTTPNAAIFRYPVTA